MCVTGQVGAIDRLWTSLTGYGKFRPYTGFLYQHDYTLLSVQVQKAVGMKPPYSLRQLRALEHTCASHVVIKL